MLRVRRDHAMHAHLDTLYVTKSMHFFCSVDEFFLEPNVLSHSPEDLSIGTSVRAIPLHQIQCCGQVLGNRFLRQYMLPSLDGLTNVVWLGRDWQS